MRSFLVDVNVWLALCSDRHIHYAEAHRWFADVPPAGAQFCRFTQLALLRLLTNPRVMGSDTVSQAEAWRVYDRLSADARVSFVSEPVDVERFFRNLTRSSHPETHQWSDAYLAALAIARDMTVVSFDQGFQRMRGAHSLILSLSAGSG
jgi:toxin-antitoxin system PIN domain toxin